jgi:hypothetical protein
VRGGCHVTADVKASTESKPRQPKYMIKQEQRHADEIDSQHGERNLDARAHAHRAQALRIVFLLQAVIKGMDDLENFYVFEHRSHNITSWPGSEGMAGVNSTPEFPDFEAVQSKPLVWISHQFERSRGRAGFQPRRRERLLFEFALVRWTISLTNCSAHERAGKGQIRRNGGVKTLPFPCKTELGETSRLGPQRPKPLLLRPRFGTAVP